MASALICPSRAEETIPPLYPDPSPAGKRPLICGCILVAGFLGIRTGELVRLSTASTRASFVTKPFIFRLNCRNPSFSACVIKLLRTCLTG